MERTHRYLLITILIMVSGVLPVHADIYAFKDNDGTVHLSNVPTDSRYTLALQEPRPAASNATKITSTRHHNFARLVIKVAREHHVDPALINAVITVESSFNPHAVSDKGAVGLMQLMPNIARRYGVSDRYNPMENVQAGASYLSDLLLRFDGDIQLALAAYNAGEEAVTRNGNHIPRNRETPTYVQRVLELYRRKQPQYD